MVKLTPDQQLAFIRKAPEAFQPCRGVWGERGATNVHLASVKPAALVEAFESAYQNVMAADHVRPRTQRSAKRVPARQPTKNPRATINRTKP
jgi:hypothetical protein